MREFLAISATMLLASSSAVVSANLLPTTNSDELDTIIPIAIGAAAGIITMYIVLNGFGVKLA